MKDPLLQLVSDTLLYLKDPLHPKSSLLATEEECALLKSVVQDAVVVVEKKPIHFLTEKKFTPPKQEVQLPPSNYPKPLPPTPQAVIPSEEPSPLIKAMLSKIAPGMRLVDSVPDDALGKRVSHAWREKITDVDVILLACKQDAETVEFLKTLAKAIDTHLARSKIIPAERLEREGGWDVFLQTNTFRLIIASEGLDQLKDLMRFYRANPAQNAYFLDKTLLLPLLPANRYKQLEKKAEVWKTLCQILKK